MDEEHLNKAKGGGATKRSSSLIYIIPSTYTGEKFGFINFEQLNPMEIMGKTDLTNQRQVFVEEYVRSGDHLEAAKKAGYKDTHTLRNQACKLRRECADEITDELHRNFAEIAPRALNILSDLAENAESESVRLGATRDLLDRAGFRPVDRHEIVKEKSVEELNAQLVSLVGENGAEMLISAFRSRKSISGPELAG